MIRLGLLGYGSWGPNVLRNFVASARFDVALVCDRSQQRLELVRQIYPQIPVTRNPEEVLADPSLEAVAIVTPIATHYELSLEAMRAGKHVWVEKPLTACLDEARRLCDAAERFHKVLFVDHTFVYTDPVRKVRELIQSGVLGEVRTYDSVRANLGRFSPDANVLWDLAVHDLSILDYVLPCECEALSATGAAHVKGAHEHTAHLIMYLRGGSFAHVHVDWLSPIKIRRTMIAGDERMLVYDDNEPEEKVRLYDSGILVTPVANAPPAIGYRQGKVTAPPLQKQEALGVAVSHFADCIEKDRKPITDGTFALRMVRVLEAACTSLKHRGKLVALER